MPLRLHLTYILSRGPNKFIDVVCIVSICKCANFDVVKLFENFNTFPLLNLYSYSCVHIYVSCSSVKANVYTVYRNNDIIMLTQYWQSGRCTFSKVFKI